MLTRKAIFSDALTYKQLWPFSDQFLKPCSNFVVLPNSVQRFGLYNNNNNNNIKYFYCAKTLQAKLGAKLGSEPTKGVKQFIIGKQFPL